MQAVRVENFAWDANSWQGQLQQRLTRRYPGARIQQRGTSVVLVRLNTSGPWGPDDEAFWASLKEMGIIQRWEPLGQVPPEPKRNRAIYEDIGYRIGSGERLTPKQQEVLFTQLHNLEERALTAEQEASTQRRHAEDAEEHARRMIERHNAMVALLPMLNEALGVSVQGDIGEPMTVEDISSGRVLARDVPMTEAYRTVLEHRLRK